MTYDKVSFNFHYWSLFCYNTLRLCWTYEQEPYDLKFRLPGYPLNSGKIFIKCINNKP